MYVHREAHPVSFMQREDRRGTEMTIKIEAWSREGLHQEHCVDKFEFCCWHELKKWINNPNLLPHMCTDCRNEDSKIKREA